MTLANSPHSRFYYFDGIQMGDVSNNGTSDIDYAAMITRHTTKPGTGFFTNGASSGTQYADFDASYQPINGESSDATSSRYTVQQGDTLQSIAQRIWGDSNFWYLIADANGLRDDSQLTAGVDLIIPNKVANASNSASTFRVYDPNLQLGDTSPTHPPRPQHNGGCGVFGQILMVIVAVVVTAFTYGQALPFMSGLLGSTMGAVAAGAVAGAAGSIASQGVGLATGTINKFNWSDVALSAISNGITEGIGADGLNLFAGVSDSAYVVGALRGVTANVLTQGIGVATGLQSKFDWTGVAVQGITQSIAAGLGADANFTPFGDNARLNGAAVNFVSGMAGAVAGSAIRTLSNGSDFGDNLMQFLPDVIGSTIGNAIAAGFQQPAKATVVDNGDGTGIEYTPPGSLPTPLTEGAIPYDSMTAAAAPLGLPIDVRELPPLVQTKPQSSANSTSGYTFWNGLDGPPPISLSVNGANRWALNLAATPADAPSAIDLSEFNSTFQKLGANSFPNGHDLENGATFFGGEYTDDLSLGNLGGAGATGAAFIPDLTAPDGPLWGLLPSGVVAVGTFHTHPYTMVDDGAFDSVTFSGNDVAYQIDNHLNFSVVQSDSGNQWLLLSTQQTPAYIDPAKTETWVEQTKDAYVNQGHSFPDAQFMAISSMAQQYNMVLYVGRNGVFTRVH